MTIQFNKNASLQAHNSLAVPAQAKVLVAVQTLAELRQALQYAATQSLEVLVLGEGSNTVFQQDFDGLLILNQVRGIECQDETADCVYLKVAAGENWHDFVRYCIEQGWYGLENLALIPGTVGAAPIQNIGAYGVEVKDYISKLDYLDNRTSESLCLSHAECEFAYRDSIFKNALCDRTVITAVYFCLNKAPAVNLSYPALAERFDSPPSPMDVFNAVCDIRTNKLPLPEKIPNAGSFFKNPIVDAKQHAQLMSRFPSLVSFTHGECFKLAAAWLIEQAGWKEKIIGGVRVHQQQALVIINPDCCSGRAVLQFAQAIQQSIVQQFGVQLEIEPRIY